MRRCNQPEEGGSSQQYDADPLTNSRRNNKGGNHVSTHHLRGLRKDHLEGLR